MAAKIGATPVHRPDAAAIELQAHIFKDYLVALFQGQIGLAALKRHRFAGGGDHPDNVLMHRQARVHITHWKDRPIRIAGVAEVEIAAERQRLDERRCLRMGPLPGALFGRYHAGLPQFGKPLLGTP